MPRVLAWARRMCINGKGLVSAGVPVLGRRCSARIAMGGCWAGGSAFPTPMLFSGVAGFSRHAVADRGNACVDSLSYTCTQTQMQTDADTDTDPNTDMDTDTDTDA